MIYITSQLNGDSICYSTFKVLNTKKTVKMTSITPRLNRSYRGKDGQYPVVIQILRHRQKREIDTPFRLWEDEFDNLVNQAVSMKGHNRLPGTISDINRYLAHLSTELDLISDTLFREKGEAYTVTDIVEAYRQRNDLTQLFVYADSLVGKLNNSAREGTGNNYQNACRALESFLGSRVLSFDDFTSELVDRFVIYLKERGNHPNAIVFYLKQLRAIYNKALAAHLVKKNEGPFRNQSLREEKTPKRAISRRKVQQLEKADLGSFHKDVRLAADLFMGSLCTRGMSFVDLCYLTRRNIEGNYLCYRRHKTGQPLRIFIEKPLKALLARYADPGSPYLFPMLRGGDSRKDYLHAMNRLGKRLRELGTYLGFEFPLTFYVARHTWATMARDAGVEMSVISSGMGHTSEKTTRIYLADIDPRKIDNANRLVINML